MISAPDIEAIERATISAVSPAAVEQLGDWLLPFDAGTIGRAKSAVPLRHDGLDGAVVSRIEARYHSRGLRAAFRIADDPRMEPVRAELHRSGYRAEQPTLVLTAACAAMRRVSSAIPADVASSPDDSWAAVFLGEGFDPIDGAHRIKAFSRAPDALYASVRESTKTVAAGVASFGFGWVSVHGMRTDRAHRGRGLAGRVLAGIAEAALERGIARVFLQVEDDNAPARALYRRAGFEPAWRYGYWRRA
jgi:GNAT superfamily N-acetyltransferase